MNTVTSIFSRMSANPDYEKIAVEDVRNALRNVPKDRVAIAQSRALRSLDRGIPLGTAISRAIAWARCAIDPVADDYTAESYAREQMGSDLLDGLMREAD